MHRNSSKLTLELECHFCTNYGHEGSLTNQSDVLAGHWSRVLCKSLFFFISYSNESVVGLFHKIIRFLRIRAAKFSSKILNSWKNWKFASSPLLSARGASLLASVYFPVFFHNSYYSSACRNSLQICYWLLDASMYSAECMVSAKSPDETVVLYELLRHSVLD